ncbi:hypothetical protein AWV79_13575 [Cupriavidus sp. UYMMa02A]|nr:hypothetical protein AWV79_13575 [Cupriavidus sp. UYMMa02A]
MERELKFEFASDKDAGLRDLPTLLDLKIDAPTEQMLESEYFDTPDFFCAEMERRCASVALATVSSRH